ncbi:response regulator [Zunongwangia sp. H14]|uniref:response regulator n=1 Tax=Zunongwangia sp. H14 TaxID=3240792 RepID=UPI003562B28A
MKFDKIVMIDDEPIINAIQAITIKEHFPGTEIIKTNFPQDALEIIKKYNEADNKLLIFLDLNMPVLSAKDVLDQLDDVHFKHKPVIFILTFSKNPEEIEEVANHPYVKELFMKPINKEKIKAILSLLD